MKTYDLPKGKALTKLLEEEPPAKTIPLLESIMYVWETEVAQTLNKETRDRGKRCLERLAELKSIYSQATYQALDRLGQQGFTSEYIESQRKTMEANLEHNPSAAIGQAKELLESCYKTILAERGAVVPANASMPKLAAETLESLGIAPRMLNGPSPQDQYIRKIVSQMQGMIDGLVEMRNKVGGGHGKVMNTSTIPKRYGLLAINASLTAIEFLWADHQAKLPGGATQQP
ncbi:abortive infection family protein [Boudabousia liubingyangii]|uniref:abortive infection family protein n=1 Tax=Boudabousia liubingyangii TaxID=1921764 RepID=UPI0013014D2E|nr:abortive infection family protein [Boudabousia liubingyangii]